MWNRCEAYMANLPTAQCILFAGHDKARSRPAVVAEIIRFRLDLLTDPQVIDPPTQHVARVEWGHDD